MLTVGNKISVDRKAQTVILPIHGYAVPFHINTIKNASKNDEGEFTYLRINFQTPGQLAGKKEDTVSLLVWPIDVSLNLCCHDSHSKIPTQPSFAPFHIARLMGIASITFTSRSPI